MDDFSSRQATVDNGWSLEPGTNTDYSWSQGKLTISIKKANWVGSTWPYGDYLDFAAEAEAQPVGTDYAEYGMVFRVSGQSGARSYYAFGLRTDGKYYVYQNIAGVWMEQDAVAPTASSQIKQGAAKNTLGVIIQGNKISLLINRVLVKSVVDDSVTAAGRVGLFAGSGSSNANSVVAFTKLTILPVAKAKADWGVP
jgi:hypothetical protein